MARTTILLVEDDPSLNRLLARALTRDGHQVVSVADARRCIRWLESTGRDEPVDLVLTDLRMPGGGFEFLASICRTLPGVPVILMTAFGDATVHVRAREAGVLEVFDKPVDLDVLRARIFKLVAA